MLSSTEQTFINADAELPLTVQLDKFSLKLYGQLLLEDCSEVGLQSTAWVLQ